MYNGETMLSVHHVFKYMFSENSNNPKDVCVVHECDHFSR